MGPNGVNMVTWIIYRMDENYAPKTPNKTIQYLYIVGKLANSLSQLVLKLYVTVLGYNYVSEKMSNKKLVFSDRC